LNKRRIALSSLHNVSVQYTRVGSAWRYEKIIYISIRMNNNFNNSNGGAAALLLMCLSSSFSSSSSASVFAGSIASAAQAGSFIKQQNTSAYDKAKGAGLNADEIRTDLERAYKAACVMTPTGGSCPLGMRIGPNGCCEFLDPAKMTTADKIKVVAKSIAEEMIISFMFEKVVSFAVKTFKNVAASRAAAKAAASTGGKLGAKVSGKVSTKVASKLSLSSAKATSSGPLIAATIAFEVLSAVLDIADPMGYNTFQPNAAAMNTRNVIDVKMEKMLKEGKPEERSDYPMTFPLSVAFPQHDQKLLNAMTEKFLPDALTLVDEDITAKIFADLGGSADMSEDVSNAIADALDLIMSKKHHERDKFIYDFYRQRGLGLHVEYVKFMSTPKRIGVTLSKFGADRYNKKMEPLHLKYSNPYEEYKGKIPEDYSPMVAVYTNTYRVLNAINPGGGTRPNVVDRKLQKKIVLAFPYSMIVSQCTVGMLGGQSERINPKTYGVKFNNETGYCDFTKAYCTRFGLEFKNNDCKLRPGQRYAEMIFGTTITRSIVSDWDRRISAFKSGDPGQIALATALTVAERAFPVLLGYRLLAEFAYNSLKGSYGRGVGRPLVCRQGYERKGALCYPMCRPGYKSRALECEGVCPPGSKNTGLTCIQGIHSYIPSNKCSNPFKKCFYQRKPCREGFRYRGSTCNRECLPGFKFRSGAAGSAFCDKPRNRYSRAGKAKVLDSCPPGMEKDGALCYKQCRQGYRGDGPLCKKKDRGKYETVYDLA
jgi:hypothetical protein